jgi:hypothetical protein
MWAFSPRTYGNYYNAAFRRLSLNFQLAQGASPNLAGFANLKIMQNRALRDASK